MHKDDNAYIEMHCEEPWFSHIKAGRKKVEGRKASPKWTKLQAGDILQFTNGSDDFLARVTGIETFASVEDYLDAVGVGNALPGVDNKDAAVEIYLQWSSHEQLAQLGFLAIHIEVMK